MSTNLLIGYPLISNYALLGTTTTAATDFEAANLFNAPRSEHFKIASAATTSQVDIDFGSNVAPDFYCIMRADLIRKNDSADSNIDLIGSDSSSFSSPSTYTATLTNARLVGPNNEDFIEFPSSAASKRYWRLKITTTASFKHEYSKFAFGVALDLSRDPLYPRKLSRKTEGVFSRKANYTIDLNWAGITDANRKIFDDNIETFQDTMPVYLFTKDYHDLLNEHKIIQCNISKSEWQPIGLGLNNLSCRFEETI